MPCLLAPCPLQFESVVNSQFGNVLFHISFFENTFFSDQSADQIEGDQLELIVEDANAFGGGVPHFSTGALVLLEFEKPFFGDKFFRSRQSVKRHFQLSA